MCSDGEKKASAPSWFEYLVAETLLAYLDLKCITPQQAEKKLHQWGARPVRARECITHLWHILAISSKSPDGCAEDVVQIEEDVIQGKRASLDYAHVCAYALKQVKHQTENTRSRRKISSSVMHGLEVKRARKTKVDVLFRKRKTLSEENAKNIEKHVTIISKHGNEKTKHADDVNNHEQTLSAHAKSLAEHVESANELARNANQHARNANEHARNANEHARNANEHARNANEHVKEKVTDEEIQKSIAQKGVDLKQASCNSIKKKRKRSRQFKNVPLAERKRIKAQCIQLLSTL